MLQLEKIFSSPAKDSDESDEEKEMRKTLEQMEEFNYPEFIIWKRKFASKEEDQANIRQEWLKLYRDFKANVEHRFQREDNTIMDKKYLVRNFYTEFKLKKSVIPRTMIKDEINSVYSNQDLLLQLDDGFSFNNIVLTQILICCGSVFMNTYEKYTRVDCTPDEVNKTTL